MSIKPERIDYWLYQTLTDGKRYREMAFMNALFKVKKGGHIQHEITGEYGAGKTTTAWTYARWDNIYTRILLYAYRPEEYEKYGETLHFSIKRDMIISPQDPAAKYIYGKAVPWVSRVVDEAEDFASTATATTKETTRLKRAIGHNRKRHPSTYWIWPNIFKTPSTILETMDGWTHKEDEKKGDILHPPRVIQMKDKFDRKSVEKWAKTPIFFPSLIKRHSGFVMKAKFPRIREDGKRWQLYLDKYEKYTMNKEELATKVSMRDRLFEQLDNALKKKVLNTSTKEKKGELIRALLTKALGAKAETAQGVASVNDLAQEFFEWSDERVAEDILSHLNKRLLDNIKIDKVEE